MKREDAWASRAEGRRATRAGGRWIAPLAVADDGGRGPGRHAGEDGPDLRRPARPQRPAARRQPHRRRRPAAGRLPRRGDGPVYGFVNGVQEEREPDSVGVLSLWRAAGHPLGNHTWTHMSLNTNSLSDWEADLVRNEPLLEKHMAGQDWRWLRYPFLTRARRPRSTSRPARC
jgi:peptidoglycan/xylan/chitin deacetylase (PgdA/CDA1 family)